ncbi:hypothetical protein C8R44DRAFT_887585 [Mycena epipterygia]|nr:hypothetical protein C8R44DRAFT_887585 [Mycena epipterygia]
MSSAKTLLYAALSSSTLVKTLEAEILERQQRLVTERDALAVADANMVNAVKGLNKDIATAKTKLAAIKEANSIYEGQIALRKAEIDNIWREAEVSLGEDAAASLRECMAEAQVKKRVVCHTRPKKKQIRVTATGAGNDAVKKVKAKEASKMNRFRKAISRD